MPGLPLWRPADLFHAARLVPELLRFGDRINTSFLPPGLLVTRIMQRPVVGGTKGDGPFIARFSAESPDLGETDVMCLGWRPTTDQARLIGDEAKVIFIADAARSLDGEPGSGALGWSLSSVHRARWFRGILGQFVEARPIELAEGIGVWLWETRL